MWESGSGEVEFSRTPGAGTTVYLRDVGTVENGTDLITAYAHVDGKRTVYIPVTKRADASTLSVINAVKAAIPEFKKAVPDDVDVRLYEAQEDGVPVAVVVAIDNPGADGKKDCGVYFGATDPKAAGNRFGRMLLTAALVDARARGCATASGQASIVGGPIWAKLGFETVFMLDTFTRTEPADA